MPNIQMKANIIRLDKTLFTNVVSDHIIVLMRKAALESLTRHFDKIPVWTGESRGGLRALAAGLGLSSLNIHPVKDLRHKVRRNRFGKIKSPTSAGSLFIDIKRELGNRVTFSYFNNGDGFVYNHTAWGFDEAFRRGIRQRLGTLIANDKLPIKEFTVTKVITNG